MSIFTLFSGSKKSDAERMQDAAHGRSVLGDVFGSSPYMVQWNAMNKEINKQYKKQEKSLRKQWRTQDQHMEYELGKTERKYGEGFVNRKRKEIQRERDRQLEKMELDRNHQVRNIAPTIKQYR